MILHNPVIADNISRPPLTVALTFNHQPSKVFKYFHKYLGFKWLPLISSMNFHFSIPNILIEHEVLEIHLQPDKSWSKQVSKQLNFHRSPACRGVSTSALKESPGVNGNQDMSWYSWLSPCAPQSNHIFWLKSCTMEIHHLTQRLHTAPAACN